MRSSFGDRDNLPTYSVQARALEPLWNGNPLSVAKLRERRVHLHWALDALVSALFRESGMVAV